MTASLVRSLAQGGVQNRVSPNVYPVVLRRWNVAGLAAGIEAGRHILLRVLRLEQRPAPALGIQGVLGKSPLRVLDHHEPDLDASVPTGLPGRELIRAGFGDLL